MRKYLPLLFLLIITACTTPLPTSQRLEIVRKNRLIPLSIDIVKSGFTLGAPLHIKVYKEERVLEVWMPRRKTRFDIWSTPELYKSYPICAVSGSLGPKLAEGDKQAPEGFYAVKPNDLNPWSKYHLSMNIGFPNAWDSAQGLTGSFIMIHGDCRSEGCFAITNSGIEDVYLMAEQAFKNGQKEIPVHSYPFRMTYENLNAHQDNKWINFWTMLASGSYY